MITNGLNSYLVIINYGSLIMLSSLLIANPLGVNKKANLWFGITTLLWSTFWTEEIFALVNLNMIGDPFLFTVHFVQFFTPITFYLSIVYYTNPDFRFIKTDFKFLLLPIIFFACLIKQQLDQNNEIIQHLITGLTIIQALYFVVISYLKIKNHKKKIQLFASDIINIDLKWLEYIIIALLSMVTFISFYNILLTTTYLNIFGNIFSTIIIFFIANSSLKQKEIFLLNENERSLILESTEDSTTEKRKIISDKDLEHLKQKLTNIMDNQRPFLDSELRLITLAELIEITPHQLSYVINEGFNENFFLFVNRYRVERVKELLLKKEKNHLSVLGIAFESGFNSKTSFNTTFKKISAQTPSEFKKSCSPL